MLSTDRGYQEVIYQEDKLSKQLKKKGTHGLYSLQRRRERYRVIYTWKVLKNLVPSIKVNKIRPISLLRHGRVSFPAAKEHCILEGARTCGNKK